LSDIDSISLGVDPDSVASESKRNQVLLPSAVQIEVDAALQRLSRPFVLLHSVRSYIWIEPKTGRE
jgi:hypothetical protein